MRYAVFVIPAGVLGMYLAPVGRPATLEQSLELGADYVNRHGLEGVSPELGTARFESEVINKDTLVIRMVNVPIGYVTADSNHWRKKLRGKVCETEGFRELFERGGKIRFEIISNIGVEAAAIQFSQC